MKHSQEHELVAVWALSALSHGALLKALNLLKSSIGGQ